MKKPATKTAKQAKQKTAGTVWEEKTHLALVLKAIAMMEAYANTGGRNPHAKDFIDSFTKNIVFTEAWKQGLKDADNKSPWQDNNWVSHFYNPRSGKNFSGKDDLTAHNQAIKYFKLSQHYAQRILHFVETRRTPAEQLYRNAGYYLGLSLHFFTDLIQPMHAANFTNGWGLEGSRLLKADLRHAGFEIYTDDAIERGLLNNLRPLQDGDLVSFPENYVGEHIDKVAKLSKTIFDDDFRKVVDGKRVRYDWWIVGEFLKEGYWRAREADPLIEKTTKLAPYDVANYLTNWMLQSRIKPKYVSSKWYEFQAPPKGASTQIVEHTGGAQDWVIRYPRTNKDNQKFYFIFNADGTVCIGLKDFVKTVWLVAETYTPSWIGTTNTLSRATRFRIATYADTPEGVMIFESTKNDALTLNTGQLDNSGIDYYARYAPAYNKHHSFKMVEVGKFDDDEVKAVRKHYPEFDTYDWAGDPDTVPEWEKKIPGVTGNALFSKTRATKKPVKVKAKARTKPVAKKS